MIEKMNKNTYVKLPSRSGWWGLIPLPPPSNIHFMVKKGGPGEVYLEVITPLPNNPSSPVKIDHLNLK